MRRSESFTAVFSPPEVDGGVLRGPAGPSSGFKEQRERDAALRPGDERVRPPGASTIDAAIFMLDPDGYVTAWNSGGQHLKGYAAAEVVGRHFSSFYAETAVDADGAGQEACAAAGTGRFVTEGWRKGKDGSKFWVHVTIAELRDLAGERVGFGALTRDLPESRRLETLEAEVVSKGEMLRTERLARLEAQRALRLKDEFFANLSHELRTPLSATLGWVQVLRKLGNTNAGQFERGMEAIERNSRAQAQLIEDLLDLNRIVSGSARLDLMQVDLSGAARGAVESAQPLAQEKGINLKLVLDCGGDMVVGDPARLQQIFGNLIGNAIKFTDAGGWVEVALRRMDSRIALCVSDSGIGISADFLPYVFDRFSQRNGPTTRSYGGLGLGLAISKQLVELHGGTVTASSHGEGKGSTIVVMLPLAAPGSGGGAAQSVHPALRSCEGQGRSPSLAGLDVLFVDDEPDARELTRTILEAEGAHVIVASNGADAIRALEKFEPDILISDIRMPDMDGCELMRQIRAGEKAGHELPALAVTARARSEDRETAILAGFQSYIAKPVDVSELITVVAGLVGRI
jgi:hypothetical protein